MPTQRPPKPSDSLPYRTEALRAQLTCLLVVSILHLFVRGNQYLIGAIQARTAIFACGALFLSAWVTWSLRNYLDLNINEDDKPQVLRNATISKFVGALLISTSLIVVAISYMEFHDLPDKWAAVAKGRHLLMAQSAIVIAGLSLSRVKVWLVAAAAVALHITLTVLAVEVDRIQVTKSMYAASMSPALNVAWEFRSIITVVITAYATATFCNLYEGLLQSVLAEPAQG